MERAAEGILIVSSFFVAISVQPHFALAKNPAALLVLTPLDLACGDHSLFVPAMQNEENISAHFFRLFQQKNYSLNLRRRNRIK